MGSSKLTTETPVDLNAKLNLWAFDDEGNKYVDFEADKQAVRQYFLQEVNTKFRFFHTLREKLEFMFENEYYEKEVWSQYGGLDEDGNLDEDTYTTIKELYKYIYSFKFRFPTYISALKFQTSYCLKSFDGKTFLERFEERVAANALMLGRGDIEKARMIAKEMITGRLQTATPTFANAGKAQRGEYVSCFLLRVEDNMESISRNINNSLQLSKRGGGVALNLTNIREYGAPIKKIEGQSSGIIPVMKLLEDSFSYANQLGQRQGAGAVYLNAHHPDIMKFLDTKRENADEKIRIKTLSLGVVVPNITFELAKRGDTMYLFSPYDVERVYGKPMSDISISDHYYEMVDNPQIRKKRLEINGKPVTAREFFQTIAEVQFESGYPYLMFEDTVNEANAIGGGRVNMSNLCVVGSTEILTDQGYRKVEDLYSSQEDFDVVVDTRARDLSEITSYGVSTEKSTKMFKTAENAEVYKITTVEGYEIEATAWHKFYVYRDNDIVKIPLTDVEVGDKVLVQSGEGTYGDIHDPDLAYLAGTLASDGSFGETRNGSYVAKWYLYDDKEEFKNAIEEASHRVLSPEVLASRGYSSESLLNKYNATLNPLFNYSEKTSRWSMSSAPLSKMLSDALVDKNSKLVVPDFVLRGDKETQSKYISGVFQMDGSITGSESNGSCSIELGSVSKEFLQSLQKMLINMGIYSRVYKTRDAGVNLLPDGKGAQKFYSVQALYSLRVSESASRIELFNLVNWKKAHLDRWKTLKGGASKRTKARLHKFTATVKSVSLLELKTYMMSLLITETP